MMFCMLALCIFTALPLSQGYDSLDVAFEDWRIQYQKSYTSVKELVRRKTIWKTNMKKINDHNEKYALGQSSFSMGMNHFGDLNSTEFNAIYSGTKPQPMDAPIYMPRMNGKDPPPAVDWRKKGYVTSVKDQGQCGSCWAFSAVGALEGQHMRQKKVLVNISPQNLLDCCRIEGNSGCKGGWMSTAFKCVQQEKGIEDEVHYPYTAKDSTVCRYDAKYNVQIDFGTKSIKKGDEGDLEKAVADEGPVSVAIDTSPESFQFYLNGVFDEPKCSSDKSDHAVLVVGYGELNGKKYWIAKNSWSHWWGMKGYILMSKDKDNQCAIATYACFPIV